MSNKTVLRKLRGAVDFARREEGSASVEFVLWLPMMVGLLALITDVSLLFYQQSYAVRVVQDANRALSLGRIASASEVQTQVNSTLVGMSPNVQVYATLADGIITTEALMPASDLDAVGWFTALSDVLVVVRAQHLVE